MANRADVARGTRADATRHAWPRGRAVRGPRRELSGLSWHKHMARATRVHADTRGGATWRVERLAAEGPTGYWALVIVLGR